MSSQKTRLVDTDVKSWLPTKAQKKRRYPSAPQLRKRHWFLGGATVVVCSWISFSSTASINDTVDSIELAEDSLVVEQTQDSGALTQEAIEPGNSEAAQAEKEPELRQITHKIKRGDTLGAIFAKYDFPRALPQAIVDTPGGKRLRSISIGTPVHFFTDDTDQLKQIRYPVSALSQLVVDIDGDSIEAAEQEVPHQTIIKTASGTITSSLFDAASQAGIREGLIMDMAAIFGWDIDFVRDLRGGDQFTLVYEQHVADDRVLANGNILVAEFINQGDAFTAVRYTDNKGETGYYSPDGKSMKGTFLKSPMKFSRVSSGFSLRRFHPVLKTWRAHKGVDYAAPTGTPIRTTASGKVTFVGRKGGYGRVVIISHGGKYSTLYAHMSRFKKGVRTGSNVKQGQTIGYVGSSGLATGPHLHYEFRVNGVHRNPLTFKTPKATPIPKSEMASFKAHASDQLALLGRSQETLTANDPATNVRTASVDQQP